MNNTNRKCRNCFFGYPIDGGEKAECHIARPTSHKWPTVRGCDWCSFWTDEGTGAHPLLIPPNGLGRYWDWRTAARDGERGQNRTGGGAGENCNTTIEPTAKR